MGGKTERRDQSRPACGEVLFQKIYLNSYRCHEYREGYMKLFFFIADDSTALTPELNRAIALGGDARTPNEL